MAYSTQDDVQLAVGGSVHLIELSDQENTGSINAAVVVAAIANADAWINSYLQRRYAVPLAIVPDEIRRMSAAEAVYLMKAGRNMVGQQEIDRHEERLGFLRDCSKGLASPGVDPEPPASTNVAPAILPRSTDENISRESLERW